VHLTVLKYIHKINSISKHHGIKISDFSTNCRSIRLQQAGELIKSKEATEHVLPVKCYRNVNSRNQLNLNLKAAIKCAFKKRGIFPPLLLSQTDPSDLFKHSVSI
jgi:hypothetical protein